MFVRIHRVFGCASLVHVLLAPSKYGCARESLVHVLLALLGSAVAADLDLLARELVVVGQLLTGEDLPQGEDDDVLLTENITDFAVAVRLKTKILVGVCRMASVSYLHHMSG